MKEKIIEYINFRIEQERKLKPYGELLGVDSPIFNLVYDTDKQIEKLLNISLDVAWAIDDYVITFADTGCVPTPDGYDYWDKEVRSVEDLAEWIVFYQSIEKFI